MMEVLREYVGAASANELRELLGFGYEIIYQDVNLQAIYEVLLSGIHETEVETEVEQQIRDMFGYYGLGLLLQVDGMFYWLMQV